MSAVADVDTSTIIYKMKCPTGERACIVGTATSVKCIAQWFNAGETAEEIQADYDHLTLEQVNAALAYYHSHRDEIDSAIERDRQAFRELRAKGGVDERDYLL